MLVPTAEGQRIDHKARNILQRSSRPLSRPPCLRRDANDPAGRSRSGVASLQALLAVAPAQVVGTGVDDNGAANDTLWPDELHEPVLDGALGVSLAVRLDIAEIADVADLVVRRTVS